jgi:hypothetical protein
LRLSSRKTGNAENTPPQRSGSCHPDRHNQPVPAARPSERLPWVPPLTPATGTTDATSNGGAGYAGNVAAAATYAAASTYNVQARYNIAYTQCTYASGNAILPLPASVYGYYAYAGEDYPWYGDPRFEWAGLGFSGGSVFVFNRDHGFHHGFHDGLHEGFHGNPHGGGMHGGGRGRG